MQTLLNSVTCKIPKFALKLKVCFKIQSFNFLIVDSCKKIIKFLFKKKKTSKGKKQDKVTIKSPQIKLYPCKHHKVSWSEIHSRSHLLQSALVSSPSAHSPSFLCPDWLYFTAATVLDSHLMVLAVKNAGVICNWASLSNIAFLRLPSWC